MRGPTFRSVRRRSCRRRPNACLAASTRPVEPGRRSGAYRTCGSSKRRGRRPRPALGDRRTRRRGSPGATTAYKARGESSAVDTGIPSMRRPPRVASQSFPPATTAMPFDPAGTERRVGIVAVAFCAAPIVTRRFPVAASAAAPAPITKATAKATRRSAPRDLAAVGPSAVSASERARAVASRVGFGRRANASRSRCSSSADIVHLVAGPQLLQRAGESRVDGPRGDAEQLADRGRRIAEPVAQHDHHATLKRKAGDRIEKLVILAGHVVPFEPRELGFAGDQAALGPEEVETPVDDDPVQPGPEGPAFVEAGQRGERALERVLRNVVGKLAPTGDHVRGTPR